MSAYTSYELDYSFDEEEFKTVNRLFSSKFEAFQTGMEIADLRDDKKSITLRVRRLDHD